MTGAELVGTWRLEDFSIAYSDGRPAVHPLGSDAVGMILYAADGHLSAVLSRADRAPLGVGGLERAGRSAGQARAAEGYVSYAGRWRLSEGTIHHTVQLSLVPDVVGQTLSRRASLRDGLLTLSYEITPRSGVTRRYRLTWRRAGVPA